MTTARQAAAATLARQAPHFPELPPTTLDVARLEPRDARLAHAIHRTTLERWITLTFLLETKMKRDLDSVEPRLQAILLSGAAQLLFLEKIPAHAVVNDAVNLAKKQMREGAGKLVNAVLRKIDGLIGERHDDQPWSPATNRIPLAGAVPGAGYLTLTEPIMPSLSWPDEHLAAATSHPVEMVKAWRRQFGAEQATKLLLHSLQTPPLIVAAPHAAGLDPVLAQPHETPGFFVWRGDHAALVNLLSGSAGMWVQDPTSSVAVTATAGLHPHHILDFCAGRGTKTHQLAYMHSRAIVSATDPDAVRFADLQRTFSEWPKVTVVPFDRIHELSGRADLLLLDVPCSNTGVLARRLEARYRYTERSLASVAALQRRIITDAAPLLGRNAAGKVTAAVLYSTCSIEPRENTEQAKWAAAQLGLTIKHEQTILPGGSDTTYHDGGYHALLAP